MKKLVIYYSLDGNTKFVAGLIAETIEAELLELKPKDKINPRGFMKYFWGGRQVVMKKKPELLPINKQVQDYDVIFIGTPVWAWSYSPPLATFLSTAELQGKKIALFCCHGGGKGPVLRKLRQSLSGNEIIGEADFLEPLNRNKEGNSEKAKKWAEETVSKYK